MARRAVAEADRIQGPGGGSKVRVVDENAL